MAKKVTPFHSSACGIDFGTSNSTLAEPLGRLVPLEGEKTTLPSAVFYGHEKQDAFLIGRAAVDAYVDGASGRLMRALKSILSQSLIHEDTPVFKRRITFAGIIAQYLTEMKRRAQDHLGRELTQVVMGRPVQFVDNDEAGNTFAEKTLGDIARAIGFKEVSFQFEPVAAALEFERSLTQEKLALIADLGGGTSDFSAIRLGPARRNKERKGDVLANAGTRVGGTDFDKCLSLAEFMPSFGYRSGMKRADLEAPNGPYIDLSTWSQIHNLYEPKFIGLLRTIKFDSREPQLIDRLINLVRDRQCHRLLMSVEESKITLSNAQEGRADLSWFEKNFGVDVHRTVFEKSGSMQYEKLATSVKACLKTAGLAPADIDVIFLTGGTSMIPSARKVITDAVPGAAVVDGDQFGAVGLGLGLEAANRYG